MARLKPRLGSVDLGRTMGIKRVGLDRGGGFSPGFVGERRWRGCAGTLGGFPGCEEGSDGRVSARGSSWRSQRGSPCLRATAVSASCARRWRPAVEAPDGGGDGVVAAIRARVSGAEALTDVGWRLLCTHVEETGKDGAISGGVAQTPRFARVTRTSRVRHAVGPAGQCRERERARGLACGC